MFTEELLSEVETMLHHANPKGIKGNLNEIFVRDKDGVWISKRIRTNNPAATKKDITDIGYAIMVLGAKRELAGVVHAHVARIVGDAAPRDVLMLSGSGPTGRRLRVYKLVGVAGLKQPAGLLAAFNVSKTDKAGGSLC